MEEVWKDFYSCPSFPLNNVCMHDNAWVRVKFCQGRLLISATKMSSYTGTEENVHHFLTLNIPEINDDGKNN